MATRTRPARAMSPTRTAGRCGSSTGNSMPSMVMRPPSIAHGGRTTATRGDDMTVKPQVSRLEAHASNET